MMKEDFQDNDRNDAECHEGPGNDKEIRLAPLLPGLFRRPGAEGVTYMTHCSSPDISCGTAYHDRIHGSRRGSPHTGTSRSHTTCTGCSSKPAYPVLPCAQRCASGQPARSRQYDIPSYCLPLRQSVPFFPGIFLLADAHQVHCRPLAPAESRDEATSIHGCP